MVLVSFLTAMSLSSIVMILVGLGLCGVWVLVVVFRMLTGVCLLVLGGGGS